MVQAVLDSGATLSLVNREVVGKTQVPVGRKANVQDYCGSVRVYAKWCNISIRIENEARNLRFLVVVDLKYDMLISRAGMKEFRLNLHYNDTISFGESTAVCFTIRANAYVKRELESFKISSMNDVKEFSPGVVSLTPYPEPVRKFLFRSG